MDKWLWFIDKRWELPKSDLDAIYEGVAPAPTTPRGTVCLDIYTFDGADYSADMACCDDAPDTLGVMTLWQDPSGELWTFEFCVEHLTQLLTNATELGPADYSQSPTPPYRVIG